MRQIIKIILTGLLMIIILTFFLQFYPLRSTGVEKYVNLQEKKCSICLDGRIGEINAACSGGKNLTCYARINEAALSCETNCTLGVEG